MADPEKKKSLQDWGLLFGDRKDQTLSDSTRNECLALLTQNEIMSRGLSSNKDDSPQKKIFLKRATMINDLTHASEERTVGIQSMLCMDYLSSKTQLLPNLDSTTNGSHNKETPLATDRNHVLQPNVSVGPMSALDMGINVSSGMCYATKKAIPKVCGGTRSVSTNPLWTNTSNVDFPTRWQALHSLGPWITTPKTLRVKDSYVSEYKCVEKSCIARMRLSSQDEGWFAPTVLEFLHLHNHESCSWETHYRHLLQPDKTSKKPKAGLPPLVKALTDQFSLEAGLEPNEIYRKIAVCFRMDPLWAGAETRVLLKVQVNQRIRYMRKKTPNQLKIEFTHDVLKFKETYKLQLPPDHVSTPILSEIHLAEVARSYETRGFLHGRKSQVGVPHRDLVVLQYNESIHSNERFLELVAKREKEYVLANTVVFTSLALLWNLCGANELDWQVCGSADGTFNCCSNDYKLIGIGLFSINHDGTKRFHPLVYALAQGEIELVALIAMHHMKEASREIFGLTPRFRGGAY